MVKDSQSQPVGTKPKINNENRFSVENYLDSTKQLVTIASSIIALVLAFATDFIAQLDSISLTFALSALVLFFVSIVLGILTINAASGMIDPNSPGVIKEVRSGKESTFSVYGQPLKSLSLWQWITFVSGLASILFSLLLFFLILPSTKNQVVIIEATRQSIITKATVDALSTEIYTGVITPTIPAIEATRQSIITKATVDALSTEIYAGTDTHSIFPTPTP